ncbi:MAG: hypothetical protein V1773_13445 [bacterium]
MKRIIPVLIISALLVITGCDFEKNPVTQNTKTNEQMYELAIQDAMVAEESEISKNLIAITPTNNYLSWSNGYVLVVTWTKYSSSYPVSDTISTWWGETWVTVVPEMKDFYKRNKYSREKLTVRTEQLLGLPNNSGNTYFVEMWVKPEDLLRPAYDNEVTDNTCGLSFPETTSDEYILWFNNTIISSYYPNLQNAKHPWTRLGYTYDWGNPTCEIGLSEFIIKKNAEVIVKSVQATFDYI